MSADQVYDIDDRIKIDATFKDDAGNAVDPTTVHLGIMYPDGTSVVYDKAAIEMVNDAVGYYSVEIVAEASGKHRYRWLSLGPGAGAEEGYFWVNLNKMQTLVP